MYHRWSLGGLKPKRPIRILGRRICLLEFSEIRTLVGPLMEIPEVVGLCLMGSYAAGDANELSDLDIGVFFEDGAVPLPEIAWPFAHDLWLADREKRTAWAKDGGWQASAFLPALMLYDRDGRAEGMLKGIIAAKNFSPALRFYKWDMYLNSLYRSLKYGRKGCDYGFRACAAESVLKYTEALFFHNRLVEPLPGREMASLKRLSDRVIADDGRQMDLLFEILKTGSCAAQAALFSNVEPFLASCGLDGVVGGWEGLIHLEIGRAGL